MGEFIDSEKIYSEGIESITREDMDYADSLGCKIKLIGRFRRHNSGMAEAIVAPMLLKKNHPLAMADDVFNAIMVEGNALGEALFYGRGAGKLPTASAVVADVIECLTHPGKLPHMFPWARNERNIILPANQCQTKALLRIRPELDKSIPEHSFGCENIRWLETENNKEQALIAGVGSDLNEEKLGEFLKERKDQVISAIRFY